MVKIELNLNLNSGIKLGQGFDSRTKKSCLRFSQTSHLLALILYLGVGLLAFNWVSSTEMPWLAMTVLAQHQLLLKDPTQGFINLRALRLPLGYNKSIELWQTCYQL